jgi:hypothetical protein
MMNMPEFIPGRHLCRRYYAELILPLLDRHAPGLRHSAALLGPGSEVLGLDTPMSMDHDWFPRLLIFLAEGDISRRDELAAMLAGELPAEFLGFPTRAQESPLEAGTLAMATGGGGAARHQVRFVTLSSFARQYLDWDMSQPFDARRWLTTPSQVLRSMTAGEVYHDGLGVLEPFRRQLEWYPHDVWLYRMAGAWNQIGNEEHLMPRAGFVRDELGSRIIAARLVGTIIQLCFLIEWQYAPYAKWLGSAFRQLRCADEMVPLLEKVLGAETWQDRQAAIVPAYELLAKLHNALGVTDPLPEKASPFFGRPFLVIQAGRFDAALREKIEDPQLRAVVEKGGALGGLDEISANTELTSNHAWWKGLRDLYA